MIIYKDFAAPSYPNVELELQNSRPGRPFWKIESAICLHYTSSTKLAGNQTTDTVRITGNICVVTLTLISIEVLSCGSKIVPSFKPGRDWFTCHDLSVSRSANRTCVTTPDFSTSDT